MGLQAAGRDCFLQAACQWEGTGTRCWSSKHRPISCHQLHGTWLRAGPVPHHLLMASPDRPVQGFLPCSIQTLLSCF